MEDHAVQNQMENRFSDLRTWLAVHGGFTFVLFIALGRMTRTRDVLGVMLLFFAMISQVVLLTFHMASNAEVRGGSRYAQYSEPACGGTFGRGGSRSSFVFFYAYMLLAGGKLFSLWQYCAGKADRLVGDAWTVFVLLFAAVFLLISLWIAESARRASQPPEL